MDQRSTINWPKLAAVKKALSKNINKQRQLQQQKISTGKSAMNTIFHCLHSWSKKKLHLNFEHNSGYGRHNFGRDDRNYDFIPMTSKREDNENEKVVNTSCWKHVKRIHLVWLRLILRCLFWITNQDKFNGYHPWSLKGSNKRTGYQCVYTTFGSVRIFASCRAFDRLNI